MGDDLTPAELVNLAPGCIRPTRDSRNRELLRLINAHHNKGYPTAHASGGPVDATRLWDHHRDDQYLVIIRYSWVSDDGHGVNHHSDLVPMPFGHAILAGIATTQSDDFNIGVIRDGRLAALLWIDQVVESDPVTLASISDEIGLTA